MRSFLLSESGGKFRADSMSQYGTDLRSLRDSRTYGIVCTLADLAFSRGSSLLSNLLVYLVVWWVKIYTLYTAKTLRLL